MTSKHVFFDTNILVYAFDKAAKNKQKIAKAIIAEAMGSGNGQISTQVLQEFYVVATKKLGIEPEMALTALESISALNIIIVTPEIIKEAVRKQTKFGLSFWDALILQAAETSLATILYTEDLNAGQKYGFVETVNPFI